MLKETSLPSHILMKNCMMILNRRFNKSLLRKKPPRSLLVVPRVRHQIQILALLVTMGLANLVLLVLPTLDCVLPRGVTRSWARVSKSVLPDF